jgi:hypothetical protein
MPLPSSLSLQICQIPLRSQQATLTRDRYGIGAVMHDATEKTCDPAASRPMIDAKLLTRSSIGGRVRDGAFKKSE